MKSEGEPLIEEMRNDRKFWRLDPKKMKETIALTRGEIISLLLSLQVVGFLRETGFDAQLAALCTKLVATLARYGLDARKIAQQFLDVNEAPHIYEGRIEHVKAIVDALLGNERRRVVRTKEPGKSFEIEPYTLFIYKKGLYLVGFSHAHKGVRQFALDGFSEVERLEGATFEYPADHDPAACHAGQFGLFGGVPENVRLEFAPRVEDLVVRRTWHGSQKFERAKKKLMMTMLVAGGPELISWLLSWGECVVVTEPKALRAEIKAVLERSVANYGGLVT